MSAVTALRSLAQGERPRGDLLPPCRLEAFGTEAYGEEAIVQSFRRAPLTLAARADVVEAPGHLAIFDGDDVLVADLYGDAIGRIWRLGDGEPMAAEPALGVPFDPDLVQARTDVALRAADHPALAAEALVHVEAIGRAIARGWTAEDGAGAYRTRPFLIRAFSSGADGVALFAVHRLGPDAVRTSGFAYAAARFRTADGRLASHHVVRDRAGERAVAAAPWRARVD